MKIRTVDHGSSIYTNMRWHAIDENTYDGADDSTSPMGRGATEAEAIADLKEQLAA